MYKIITNGLNKINNNGFRYASYHLFEKILHNNTVQSNVIVRNSTPTALKPNNKNTKKSHHNNLVFISAGLLSMLTKSDDETPEDKLIMNIKRSILSIQRGEFEKAESMLHLALRMAQDLNSKDGITYIFDLMANLALECEQFTKAKKLFITVMQRLLQDGYKEDDHKVLKYHYIIVGFFSNFLCIL